MKKIPPFALKFLEFTKNVSVLLFSWVFGLVTSCLFVFIFVNLLVISKIINFYKEIKREIMRKVKKRRK